MSSPSPAAGGRAIVSVFNGERQPWSGTDLLITVLDGNKRTQSLKFYDTSEVFFTGLPLFDNAGDDYTFLASAHDYKDAGFFPVRLSAGVDRVVDLMLLPKRNAFNFANATWAALDRSWPELKMVLANGAATPESAATRYGQIQEDGGGAALACLLNLGTVMRQIHLSRQTPFDYLKRLVWDRPGDQAIASDRFFVWADPALIQQIEQAAQQPRPVFESAPGALHPGATRSFKQIEFGEANLQITLHENDRREVDGVNCVLVEPDIDYFRDPGAHLLLEVAVNAFGAVTDPRTVYALRWIAGQRAGTPEFDPLYTIVKT